jgi:DNA-binding NarL/FixJ family response regulator
MLQSYLEARGKSSAGPAPTRRSKPIEARRVIQQKRFAVIDARPLRGESLACWLRSTNSRRVVSTFRKIDALFKGGGFDEQVDLILLSSGESDVAQVLDALDNLAGMSLPIPAVVVSNEDDAGTALEFLRRGARGFIPTSLDMLDAAAALDFIAAGGTFLPAPLFLEAASTDAQRQPAGNISVLRLGKGESANAPAPVALPYSEGPRDKAELTSREAKVLQCLCRGKPNKLIAYELELCESTVKMYVGRLMRKLKATNRTEVALFGERLLRQLVKPKSEHAEEGGCVMYAAQSLKFSEPTPGEQVAEDASADCQDVRRDTGCEGEWPESAGGRGG